MLGIASLAMLFVGGTALAGEHGGEGLYGDKCADCHFEDDFSGESADAIAALIDEVKAGNTKHPADLAGLSEEEVRKLADYFASQ